MMEPKNRPMTPFQRIISRRHRQPRGQSFVELMLVVLFLALLLAGMVEFGFMLNQYLHVLDGSREGARYSSTQQSFVLDTNGVKVSSYYFPPFYYQAAAKAALTMDPVRLNSSNPDDIVISVFSLDSVTPTRFPGNPNITAVEKFPDPNIDPGGWSLCAHYKANTEDTVAGYGGFAAYFQTVDPSVISDIPPVGPLPSIPWSAGCHTRTSQVTIANFTSLLGSVPLVGGSLPNTGAVLVEIYYNYPQLLKLPVLTSMVPDPIPLYVYSIMPLSSAQPTQVGP